MHPGMGVLHPGGSASRGEVCIRVVGLGRPSPQSDTTWYGQRAGVTHPTGMHFYNNFVNNKM